MIKRVLNKKKNFSELDFLNILIYLVAPFLAIPSIIYSLIKKTKLSYFLYSLLIAFISYLYIPTIEMDKSRHIEFYDFSKYLSIKEFLFFNFKDSPDFLFRLLLYIASVNNISFNYIVFFITFITVFLIFKVFYDYLKNNIIPRFSIIILLLCVFSLSYIDLLSGIRYTFAIAFSFYGLYQTLIKKNKIGLLYLIIGPLIHFSTIIYLIFYFIFPLLNKIKAKYIRLFLLISLGFLLIPQSVLLNIIKGVGLSGAIDVKVNAYLGENNLGEVKETFSTLFIKFFNIVWVVVISIYLLINKKINQSLYYKPLVFLLIFTNVFITIPVIFNRYALFIKLFLVLFLIDTELKKNNIKITLLILIIFVVIGINQMIVMRDGMISMFTPSILNWSFIYNIFENNTINIK